MILLRERVGFRDMLIVTLATQRSGTKFLGSLFRTGSEIRSRGELFNPDDVSPITFRTFVQTQGFEKLVNLGSERTLNRYFDFVRDGFPFLHFDMMYNQLEIPCISWNPFDHRFFYNYLKARSAVVISLRRSPLECYVSAERVRAGGSAHVFVAEGKRQEDDRIVEPVNFDAKRFASFEKGIQTYLSEIDREFRSYELFVRLEYTLISKSGHIGEELIRALSAGAAKHGIALDDKCIQMGQSPYRRLS